MKLIDEKALKDYAVAGLGGGAVNAMVDKFLGEWLSGLGEFGGYLIGDIAMILIAQYGKRRTKGMLSKAFDGMGVISMYEIFYEDLLGGFFGASVAGGGGNTLNSPTTTTNDILARMQ